MSLMASPADNTIMQLALLILGAMLTITTAGVIWISKTLFWIRDSVVRLIGDERAPGVLEKLDSLDERVGHLESWKVAYDAVRDAERSQYAGPERRHASRRLRDQVAEEILSDDPPHPNTP